MTRKAGFSHQILFYGDPDEFIAGVLPYLREGIGAGEPALVAVGPANSVAIRGELGADAAKVAFADMHALGRNPARLAPFWRELVDAQAGIGRPLRGIGEPVWPERTEHELDECRRHERLLNVAFDGGPKWSLLCPYDSSRLPDQVLEEAASCHPFLAGGGGSEPNLACSGDDYAAGVFQEALPPHPPRSAVLDFDRAALARVRALVAAEAQRAGLDGDRVPDLVTAASELAANSVAHGGGRGSIRVWQDSRDMVVEVVDAGLVEEPLVGRRKPLPTQHGGRGLWIANLLCDLVQIRSGPEGTAVRLRMRLER